MKPVNFLFPPFSQASLSGVRVLSRCLHATSILRAFFSAWRKDEWKGMQIVPFTLWRLGTEGSMVIKSMERKRFLLTFRFTWRFLNVLFVLNYKTDSSSHPKVHKNTSYLRTVYITVQQPWSQLLTLLNSFWGHEFLAEGWLFNNFSLIK